MADVRPFVCCRPQADLAAEVAALPYDVFSRAEAEAEITRHPHSFLRVDKSCALLPPAVGEYDAQVYQEAAECFDADLAAGLYCTDAQQHYYVYRLVKDGRAQIGVIARVATDDYMNGVVRRHENTRELKLIDRIQHIEALDAQTSPVFLAYRADAGIDAVVAQVMATGTPLYDFVTDDGVRHTVWRVENGAADASDDTARGTAAADVATAAATDAANGTARGTADAAVNADATVNATAALQAAFAALPALYIADGHHRAAAAAEISLKRRAGAGADVGSGTGVGAGVGAEQGHPAPQPELLPESQSASPPAPRPAPRPQPKPQPEQRPADYFLAILFPSNQLSILDYNRVVFDLNGRTPMEFLEALAPAWELTAVAAAEAPWRPRQRHEFGMYLAGQWYQLRLGPELLSGLDETDPVASLDVSILQHQLIAPLLGIDDPRTSERIAYVGGVRGLAELERRVEALEQPGVAFALYPTTIDELFAVADAGKLMPPKSTWFEPKPRSGLFIHQLS
ncbi:MAG: DUF1015 family protein [Coriobacteriales bacterium]|nr:DUF1015 family protein [Coriobacteriales bacterium]